MLSRQAGRQCIKGVNAPTNQTETSSLGSIVPRQGFTDAAGGTGNEYTGSRANYLRPCSVRARAIS